MEKFKLIVVAGDESVTGEFDNVVKGLEQAASRAEELRRQFCDDYPDTYVACYPLNEDIHYPSSDYRIWQKDSFGSTYWKMMKVSRYGTRLYTYLPQ